MIARRCNHGACRHDIHHANQHSAGWARGTASFGCSISASQALEKDNVVLDDGQLATRPPRFPIDLTYVNARPVRLLQFEAGEGFLGSRKLPIGWCGRPG